MPVVTLTRKQRLLMRGIGDACFPARDSATPDDTVRAAFIEPALAGLLDTIEDGVPVLGYCHWTLLDNFEWIFGYDFHYGLFEVDRDTFERAPKPSAAVYAALARRRGGDARPAPFLTWEGVLDGVD